MDMHCNDTAYYLVGVCESWVGELKIFREKKYESAITGISYDHFRIPQFPYRCFGDADE